MKKFALVLALLAIAGFVFADTVVVPTLSGSANTTFGINLNSKLATGFQTSASASAKFTLIDSQSATAAGEDDLYGEITISGLTVTGDNDSIDVTSASASAKIVAGDLYVVIGADPTFKTNKAAAIEKDNADVAADPAKDHGITIGVSSLGLKIKVSSQGDWVKATSDAAAADVYYVTRDGTLQKVDDDHALPTGATPLTTADVAADTDAVNDGNINQLYTFGADFDTAIGDLGSVSVYVAYAMAATGSDGTLGFGLGLPLTLGPASVTVGVDAASVGSDFDLDAALKLSVAAGPATIGVDVYMGDLVIGTGETASDDIDVKATVDLSSLVDALTLKIAADMYNTFKTINLTTNLAYDVSGIKPFVDLVIEGLTATTPTTKLTGGVELAAAATGIDNTTITLKYVSTDLSSDNGIITADVKISM